MLDPPEVAPAATVAGGRGRPVDLDGNGKARVVYRPSSAEVRVDLDGTFVRVTSARPALALAVARSIRA